MREGERERVTRSRRGGKRRRRRKRRRKKGRKKRKIMGIRSSLSRLFYHRELSSA